MTRTHTNHKIFSIKDFIINLLRASGSEYSLKGRKFLCLVFLTHAVA